MTKPHLSPTRLGAIAVLAFSALACQEETPTSIDSGLVPRTPITLDIELPFDSFARGVAVYGGFGRSNVTSFGGVTGHAALAFGEDQIEARTLARFGSAPTSAVVQDSTGASVTDTTLTIMDGFLTITVDTVKSVGPNVVQFAIDQITESWDAGSATWTEAFDSTSASSSWTQPGGGATVALTSATWDRAESFDTVRFNLDSTTVAALTDTTEAGRGVLLRSLTPSTDVAVRGVSLSVFARPASNPDTTVVLAVGLTDQTFIYDPLPTPDSTALWVGGTPAWRSVFTVDVPSVLNGPESLCEVVSCPVQITPELVTSALLTLRTAAVSTSFLPTDSLPFDARVVLDPERLPNAPLGGTLGFQPVALLPSYFSSEVGTDVNVPITTFVQLALAGPDENGVDPPTTLALVSTLEPSSLGFAAFAGVGQDGAPRIQLVLTIPEGLN